MTKRLLLPLFMAALMLASFASLRADEPSPNSLSRLLGVDTIVYLEVKDIFGTIERGKGLALYKFVNDPKITAMFDALKGAVPNQPDQLQDVTPDQMKNILSGLEEMLVGAKDMFSGSAALALLPKGDGTPEPWGIISLGVAQGKEQDITALLNDLPAKLQELLQANGQKVAVAARQEKVNGRNLTAWTSTKEDGTKEDLYFYVADGRLFLSNDTEDFGRLFTLLANKPTPALTELPEFRDCWNKTDNEEAFLFFNFAAIADANAAPQMAMLANYLKAAGVGVSFAGEYIRDHMMLAVQNIGQAPVLGSFIGVSTSGAAASLFPKNSQACALLNVPSFSDFWPFIKDLPPFAGIAAQFQTFGVDFSKDVLDALGGEVGVSVELAMGTADFLLAVQAKNPDKIAQVLEALENAGMLKGFDYKGTKLYDIPSPNPGMRTVMTAAKGYLLVGTVMRVKIALSMTPDKSLTSNEEFAREWSRMKQYSPAAFAFVDAKNLLGMAYDYGKAFLMMAGGGAVDPAALPDKEVFTRHFVPFGLGLTVKDDEISLRSEGMLPVNMMLAASLSVWTALAVKREQPVPPAN